MSEVGGRKTEDGRQRSEDTPVEHPKGTRFNWVKRSEDRLLLPVGKRLVREFAAILYNIGMQWGTTLVTLVEHRADKCGISL